tara:strand:+ start:4276 stop:4446 length:171 start_codon:yes stop_codon:yes gene_type:complete
MRGMKPVWVVDWDLVDSVEHIKDILKDGDLVWLEYPTDAGYLTKEAIIEIDYEDIH